MTWRIPLMALLLLVLLAQPALAQGEQPESLEQLIASFYNGAVRVVGLAAFLMLLYAGLVRMAPWGSPEQSNQIIIDAIVGLVLLLSAVIILNSINPDLTEQGTTFEQSLREYKNNPSGYERTGGTGGARTPDDAFVGPQLPLEGPPAPGQ